MTYRKVVEERECIVLIAAIGGKVSQSCINRHRHRHRDNNWSTKKTAKLLLVYECKCRHTDIQTCCMSCNSHSKAHHAQTQQLKYSKTTKVLLTTSTYTHTCPCGCACELQHAKVKESECSKVSHAQTQTQQLKYYLIYKTTPVAQSKEDEGHNKAANDEEPEQEQGEEEEVCVVCAGVQ